MELGGSGCCRAPALPPAPVPCCLERPWGCCGSGIVLPVLMASSRPKEGFCLVPSCRCTDFNGICSHPADKAEGSWSGLIPTPRTCPCAASARRMLGASRRRCCPTSSGPRAQPAPYPNLGPGTLWDSPTWGGQMGFWDHRAPANSLQQGAVPAGLWWMCPSVSDGVIGAAVAPTAGRSGGNWGTWGGREEAAAPGCCAPTCPCSPAQGGLVGAARLAASISHLNFSLLLPFSPPTPLERLSLPLPSSATAFHSRGVNDSDNKGAVSDPFGLAIGNQE